MVRFRPAPPLLFALLMLCAALPASAVDGLRLSLGNLAGNGWSVRGATLAIDWTGPDQAAVSLTAAAAALPAPIGPLADLRLSCPAARITPEAVDCPAAALAAGGLPVDLRRASLGFHYDVARRALDFTLRNARLGDGTLALAGSWREGAWTLRATARVLPVKGLLQLAAAGGYLQGYDGAGTVSGSIGLRGDGGVLQAASADLTGAKVSFNDAAGTHAGQGLDLTVEVSARPIGGGWGGQGSLRFAAGGVYLDPLYLQAPATPATLSGAGRWQAGRLTLTGLHLDYPGTGQADADLTLATAPRPALEALDLRIGRAILPGLYTNLIQPWVDGTAIGDLDTAGVLQGRVQMRAGSLRNLDLALDGVTLADRKGRFSLDRLEGRIAWGADAVSRDSDLAWSGGSLYRVALGPARLALASEGTRFRLRQPAAIPVLDGRLMIDQFTVDNPGTPALRWDFDGVLTPVSLEAFTRALGWPPLAGKLSGVIPDVHYADGTLSVGGVLLARVFGGDITVRDLRLEQPFGLVPRLQADADIKDLDLDTLTRTFSFGKIEGRLNGYVHGLRMNSWQPVAFDAAFATPSGDTSRHRISQQALQNLSSIGGGGLGGALSRGFLSFFKSFPYDRLGLNCRLADGVCRMGGVAPAPNGYYIVKGRFLPPRVDVIGYAREVDWHTLVAQLVAATRTGGARVQ